MSSPAPVEIGAAGNGPNRLRDGLAASVGVAGAVGVLIGHWSAAVGGPALAVFLAVVVLVSAWLAVVDFREHRLPNRIVGPLAVAVAAVLLLTGLAEDDLGRTGRAVGLGLMVSAFLLLANIIGGLGMGDVKYGFPMAATVGWFGWDALSVTIVITTLAGAVAAGAMLLAGRGRSYRLSYGPYMALGLVGGLLSAATW